MVCQPTGLFLSKKPFGRKRPPKPRSSLSNSTSSNHSAKSRWSTSTSSVCSFISTSWPQPGQRTVSCRCAHTSRDIFAEAVDQDFLVKDPARKLKVPAQLRATDTTTLTWDQLRLALSKLSLRDRILLELDMTNAFRPSELFAFRWKRFDYRHRRSRSRRLSTKARSVTGEKRRRASL